MEYDFFSSNSIENLCEKGGIIQQHVTKEQDILWLVKLPG